MSQQAVLDCVCRSKQTWEATEERAKEHASFELSADGWRSWEEYKKIETEKAKRWIEQATCELESAKCLTEKQKAAIDVLLTMFDPSMAKDNEHLEAGLLAKQEIHRLLVNSKPAWEATDERIKALKVAVGDIDLADNIHYLPVILAMLEEIK